MFRPFAAALTLASFAAFAQSAEEPAPPLVPVDQLTPPPPPPPEPPSQQQYQQQQKAKRQQQQAPQYQQQPAPQYQQQPAPQYQQQPAPQYQQQPAPQYQQQPAPQYQQQPAPQYQQQQPSQYQQQPAPQYQQQPSQYQQQPSQYQQQPYSQQPVQQYPQQPGPQPYPQQPPPPQYVPQAKRARPPPKDPAEGFHMKALLTGSVGVVDAGFGFTGGVRGEFDINRIAIYGAYNRFISADYTLGDAHEFTILGGYSLMANRIGRIRVLGGLDILGTPATITLNPMVGFNTRLGLGFLGFDAAAFLTVYPARQLDLRAAVVLRFWLLELHAGWRFEVLDSVSPSAGGSFGNTFLTAPSVNGPFLAIGLAF
jgi:hypothetical protein